MTTKRQEPLPIFLGSLLLAGLSLVACNDTDARTKGDPNPNRVETRIDELRTYVADQKDEFVAAARARISKLEQRFDAVSDDMRESLRLRMDEAKASLATLKEGSTEAFASARDKVADALEWMEGKLRQ